MKQFKQFKSEVIKYIITCLLPDLAKLLIGSCAVLKELIGDDPGELFSNRSNNAVPGDEFYRKDIYDFAQRNLNENGFCRHRCLFAAGNGKEFPRRGTFYAKKLGERRPSLKANFEYVYANSNGVVVQKLQIGDWMGFSVSLAV